MEPTPRERGGLEHAYRAEHEAALLYTALAAAEPDSARRNALESIAAEETSHAAYWADQLVQAGQPVPEQHLGLDSRILISIAARFGIRSVASLLVRREGQEASRYDSRLQHPGMRLEERRHSQVVGALGRGEAEPLAADPWSDNDGFNLRAAIFGVNDGLVSNLGLTAGLAGAHVDPRMIILGGAAGLLAGALSMAGGEYLSVRSQQELMQRRLELRRLELAAAPADAARLLSGAYQTRGLPREDADLVAAAILSGRTASGRLDTAGLGSPVLAAVSSFLAFAAGAAIPLLPYLFTTELGLLLSVSVSGLVLGAVGALLGTLSGRGAAYSAARMLGVGGLAAIVTYFAGRVFDIAA